MTTYLFKYYNKMFSSLL